MLTLFYSTITSFLFRLNFGPGDLELYAVNLRSHLINIAIDIMKELLLMNHRIFCVSWKEKVDSGRRGVCVDESKAFTCITRGCGVVNRKSIISGMKGIT